VPPNNALPSTSMNDTPPIRPATAPVQSGRDTALPRPRLTVRTGVTGHRPERIDDPEQLRASIRHVLRLVVDTAGEIQRKHGEGYASDPPLLRIVSPLAEGADRLVAREAREMRFELECPLPFPRDVYEDDFTDADSTAEFHEMLGSAARVLELDGVRTNPSAAYEAAGRMVLRHCDLLIAVWDGDQRRGTGGTAQIVEEAALLEIPVVWIHSRGTQVPTLLLPDGQKVELDELRAHLKSLFRLPEGRETYHLETYLRKRPSARWAGLPYRWFRDLLLIGARSDPPPPEPKPPFATAAMTAHFKHADALAGEYAGKYRSSFVLIYGMASYSVAAAAAAAYEVLGWVSAVELLLILITMVLAVAGGRRRWHQHWSEYRLLAEHLRHAQFLRPLGRVASSFRVPAHASSSDPAHSWEQWLFRALVREAGMMEGRMDARLDEHRMHFGRLVSHQLRYHHDNAHAHHVLHRRLHRLGLILFAGTIAASAYHLYEYMEHRRPAHDGEPHVAQSAVVGQPHGAGGAAGGEPHPATATAANPEAAGDSHGNEPHFPWTSFLAVVLPAFGAALVGIESQGEFSRIANRSEGMQARLKAYHDRLAAPPPPWSDSLPSAVVGEAAESAAEAMRAELMDWRVIFSEKPLRLPG
jgi:hypothetical protein